MLVHKRLVSGAIIFSMVSSLFTGICFAGSNELLLNVPVKSVKSPTVRRTQPLTTRRIKPVSLNDIYAQQRRANELTRRRNKSRNQQAFFAFGLMTFLKMFEIQHRNRLAQQQMWHERMMQRDKFEFLTRQQREKHRHQIEMFWLQLRKKGYTDEQIKEIISCQQTAQAVRRTQKAPTLDGSLFNIPKVNKNDDYYRGQASTVYNLLDGSDFRDSWKWTQEGQDRKPFEKLTKKAQYEDIKTNIYSMKLHIESLTQGNMADGLAADMQGRDDKTSKDLLLARCNYILDRIQVLEASLGQNVPEFQVYKAKIYNLRLALMKFDEKSHRQQKIYLANKAKKDKTQKSEKNFIVKELGKVDPVDEAILASNQEALSEIKGTMYEFLNRAS